MMITKVEVLDEAGENVINKPIGNYISIECDEIRINKTDNKKDLVIAVANELSKIADFSKKSVLVVGLGNQNITPDSLGPKVVSHLIVTRHLIEELDGIEDEFLQKLSSIAPGVMGQTGMETVEVIKGVVDIVQGLKNFSVVDSQEKEELRVNQCIENAIKLITKEVSNKAELILNLQAVPKTMGFPGNLSQVVLNLVLNASHAIKDRGTIKISTSLHDDNILIDVVDNGEGMDDETLQRIFDPFFTKKVVGSGTGLGLSISMGIIKKHQGDIFVTSKLGVGTRFRIVLPVLSG